MNTDDYTPMPCSNCGKPRLNSIWSNGKRRETTLCLECNELSAYHQRMAEYEKARKVKNARNP